MVSDAANRGAAPAGGAAGGGDKGILFKIGSIVASSEDEGRAAAKGFKEELEEGGFLDSIASLFEPGPV